jgi:hemin uptake protein HemP
MPHSLPDVPPAQPSRKTSEALERVTSRDLLGMRREIVIEHQGRDYRLRVTQNGKLILTA